MKMGDEIAVQIQGIDVAVAQVEEINNETVTLLIPGTRVVMGVRHSLTEDTGEPEKDRLLSDAVVEKPAPEIPEATTSLKNMKFEDEDV